MNSNPNRPVMFPCATQVSLIQVGADDFDLKVKDQLKYIHPAGNRLRLYKKKEEERETVSKPIIKRVSAGLSFTDEVVRDMAPYTIPYNEQSIYEAYDTSEFLSRAEKKMSLPSGRFNNYGPDRRHMSCHFKKTAPYRLKPIKREIMRRALEMEKQAIQKEEQQAKEEALEEKQRRGFFLTENQDTGKSPRQPKVPPQEPTPSDQTQVEDHQPTRSTGQQQEKHKWDEYLLSILSRPTAQWIVTQKTDQANKRYKPLYDYMVTKHGVPTSTELVRDDMAEYESEPRPVPVIQPIVKRPNTQSARLLQRVHDMEKEEELDTVPYADRNKASFYRQPGGIKKQIKIQQKEMGALNTTATSITVKKKELPPPPKLRDFVDPRITENTVYETDNNFQRDWLTGNKQVYQAFGDNAEIVMENHNKYTKVSQTQYPRHSSEWCPDAALAREETTSPTLVHKLNKGQQRWTGLPKPVEESSVMIASVVEELEQSMNPKTEKFKPSEALSRIVDEWRSKWHLNMRFDDATPEELIKDMEDIHPHVRIKAISTCARATAYKPPPLEGIQLFSEAQSEKANLPEKIFVALECLLDDEHAKVRLAAAISLHALQRPCDKAEEILRFNLLPDQNKADRWAAVQCLGLYGVSDSDVIGECVEQMMNNEDMIQYEKACSLLAHISNSTSLVHSMLAEHLNDCSWRHRVMALKCLPKLYGQINVDIQNKVMHLMWNDSHSDVRKSAAQSLGKCGFGRLVHDKMRQILIEGTQTERAETLSKLGYLGLMTAKMMLPFMRSFRDEYVAVRKEACITAGNLQIRDETLTSELLRLSNRDPIWRIKALAIQALGKIGISTPEIREALLWALRFEEEEGVRAEACHSIILLQLKDDEVLEILQNRMLVEEEAIVQEELAVALEFNGVSATEDMAMVAQIKAEVRKLSNRNDIYNSICVLEKEEQLAENTQRMIYIPKTPKTPKHKEAFDLDFDEHLIVDQAEDDEEDEMELNYPRPPSQSHKTYTTSISEPIIEVDEEPHMEKEDRLSPIAPSRHPSGRSRTSVKSGNTPGKSRPVSRVSSLNTEVMEQELENVMDSQNPSKGEPTEVSDSGLTPHPGSDRKESRLSSGLEKKRLSEMRGLSVTPTVLSVSLDQIEAIHNDDPSIVDKLRSMSMEQEDEDGDVMSCSPSMMKPIERAQGSRASGSSSQGMPVKHSSTLHPESILKSRPTSGQVVGGDNFTEVKSVLDPVDMSRLQCTNFLFDRYSFIDIKTPPAFSPVHSEDVAQQK